jgi:hypothetical protein
MNTESILIPGAARRVTANDYSLIAGYLGCEIAVIRAFVAVEAAGAGFDQQGRPKMLFEPHVFYKRVNKLRQKDAIELGLAYAKWGAKPYPKDSYPRLAQAMALDLQAALESASWGAGQVMGYHWKALGYDSVIEFVECMKASETAHLFAMARYLVVNKLQDKLVNKNWVGLSHGYNGASYAKNQYDKKLAAEYAKRPASERIVPPPTTPYGIEALKGVVLRNISIPVAPPVAAKPEPDVQAVVPQAIPVPVKPQPRTWFQMVIELIEAAFKR